MGRLLVILSLNNIVFSLACAFGPGMGFQGAFYLSLFLPLALFTRGEKRWLYGSAVVAPFCLALFMVFDDLLAREAFGDGFMKWFGFIHAGASALLGMLLFKRIFTLHAHYQNQAAESHRHRSKLASIISHDITGNLSIIQGSLKLLERNFGIRNQPTAKRYYDRAMRAFDAIGYIAEHVATKKGFSSEVKDLKMEATSFEDCKDHILYTFSDKVDPKGIQFHFEDKTNGTTGFLVDPVVFLHSVVSNVVSNAVKYSHPGSVIYVSAAMDKDKMTLLVEDKGIGMPMEIQSVVFDETVTDSRAGTLGEHEGSGIGLSIVKGYVAEMDGEVKIESKEDEGTKVVLRFMPVSLSSSVDAEGENEGENEGEGEDKEALGDVS